MKVGKNRKPIKKLRHVRGGVFKELYGHQMPTVRLYASNSGDLDRISLISAQTGHPLNWDEVEKCFFIELLVHPQRSSLGSKNTLVLVEF